jgi:YD repeat-containing protein
MTSRLRPPRRRRLLPGCTALLALGAAFLTPAAASAASCQDTVAATYTVRVCVTAPADGSTITADAPITGTVTTVSGTSPGVQRMVFYLDGAYLLTDYSPPYTFTLPTAKFLDGAHVVAAEALMRDATTTSQGSVGVTFATGTTTPPVNTNTFTPKVADPPPNTSLVVGAAGDGAGGESSESDTVNLISSWDPSLFLYLGDVYEKGSVAEFANWFGKTGSPNLFYGRLKAITDPTIGNHEYTAGQAPGYFDYWDNVPNYYSFDSGSWHFISLNANSAFGQTAAGSPQYQWLQSDLQNTTQPCTVVYYHQPLLNIGQEGYGTYLSDIWSLLAAHRVNLVVNGHDHTYQRWQPVDGLGNPVAPGTRGVTEIVAGMGGHAHGRWLTTDSRLAASDNTHFGALRLDFNSAGVGYRFVSTGGVTYDSGSVACDPTTADTVAPTDPGGLLAVPTYKTSISLDWTAAYDNVGVTGYQIFRDGLPLATSGPQTTYTDSTVEAGSTHSYVVRALDAAGHASGPSNSSSATTPTVAVLFHDGFESGDVSAWDASSGLVVQSDQVFAGSLAAEANPAGTGTPYAMKQIRDDAGQPSSEPTLYYETRFKVLDQPSGNIGLLRFRSPVGPSFPPIATFSVTSTDRISMRNDVTALATTSTAVATRGQWHTLQAHLIVNGASSTVEAWLDGSPIAALTQSNVNFGTFAGVGQVELGSKPTATPVSYDVIYDEVAYDRTPIGDATPPNTPGNFAVSAHSGLRVDLSWSTPADDVGVSGYDIYRDGSKIASAGPVTSWQDLTVAPLTSYDYNVVARDAAGNSSAPSSGLSVTTPDVFRDDFETGDLSRWTVNAGLAPESSLIDTGSFAARATSDGTAGASASQTLDATVPELYYRARFQVVSRGATSVSLVRLRTATNGAIASAFIASTGRIGVRNDVTGLTSTSSLAVTSGVWHEIQLHVIVSDTGPQVDVWLDGQPAGTRTDSLGSLPIGRLELGDPALGRAFDVGFDNVVADPSFVADAGVPTAPANLHTTAVTGHQVDLAWDAASDDVGVTTYRVYRDGLAIADVDGGTFAYSDTMVTDATHYDYAVTALDAVNHESAPTSTLGVDTPDATAPVAPTGLAALAFAGQGRIDLTWTASTDNVGITGYRVYRDGDAAPIGTTGGQTTTYSDTTVPSTATHSYVVTAVDAAGNESGQSNAASASTLDVAKPSAPATLAVVPTAGANRLDLSWSASTDNVAVTGYAVYRDGSAMALATTPGDTTTYADLAVTSASTHTYAVRAFDADGNLSDPSPSRTATSADTAAPFTPAGVTVATVTDARLSVSWSAATDDVAVTGYRVYRNGGATPVATLGATVTTFTDSGLAAGTSYSYAVAAFDAAGNASVASAPVVNSTALFYDGFETGNLSRWSSTTGLTAQRKTVSAGTWGAESHSVKNTASFAVRQLATAQAGVWMREQILLPKGKLSLADVLRLRTAAGGNLLALYYDANGNLGVLNDTRGTTRLSATRLAQNTWYEVKVHLIVNGTTSTAEVFVNGTRLNDISSTTESYGATSVGQVVTGESTLGRAYDTLIDEVLVDTKP